MNKWHIWALLLMLGLGSVALATDYIVINKNKAQQTCTGDHLNVTINANGCKVKVDGQCDDLNVRGKKNEVNVSQPVGAVLIPGKNNKLSFQGGIASLNVGGDLNTITLAGVPAGTKPPRIEVGGNGNMVMWSRSANAAAPDWVDNGDHNTLKQMP